MCVLGNLPETLRHRTDVFAEINVGLLILSKVALFILKNYEDVDVVS